MLPFNNLAALRSFGAPGGGPPMRGPLPAPTPLISVPFRPVGGAPYQPIMGGGGQLPVAGPQPYRPIGAPTFNPPSFNPQPTPFLPTSGPMPFGGGNMPNFNIPNLANLQAMARMRQMMPMNY
jgi:hypothetical protein